ncbi:hypothetical protein L345_15138, partial [Ophiophagus hannah]
MESITRRHTQSHTGTRTRSKYPVFLIWLFLGSKQCHLSLSLYLCSHFPFFKQDPAGKKQPVPKTRLLWSSELTLDPDVGLRTWLFSCRCVITPEEEEEEKGPRCSLSLVVFLQTFHYLSRRRRRGKKEDFNAKTTEHFVASPDEGWPTSKWLLKAQSSMSYFLQFEFRLSSAFSPSLLSFTSHGLLFCRVRACGLVRRGNEGLKQKFHKMAIWPPMTQPNPGLFLAQPNPGLLRMSECCRGSQAESLNPNRKSQLFFLFNPFRAESAMAERPSRWKEQMTFFPTKRWKVVACEVLEGALCLNPMLLIWLAAKKEGRKRGREKRRKEKGRGREGGKKERGEERQEGRKERKGKEPLQDCSPVSPGPWFYTVIFQRSPLLKDGCLAGWGILGVEVHESSKWPRFRRSPEQWDGSETKALFYLCLPWGVQPFIFLSEKEATRCYHRREGLFPAPPPPLSLD